MAPILLPRPGARSKVLARRLEGRADRDGSSEPRNAGLNIERLLRGGTLISPRALNRPTGKADRSWPPTSRGGLGTVISWRRIEPDAKAEHQQELEAPVRMWGRHIGRNNARSAAWGMPPVPTRARAPTLRDGRSVQPGSFQAQRFLKRLLLCEHAFDTGTLAVPAASERLVANAQRPGGIPGRRSLPGSVAPRRHIGPATANRGEAPGQTLEQGASDRRTSSAVFGSDIRIRAIQRGWSKPDDRSNHPNKHMGGTLYLDGSALSQWLITRLGQEAGRPCTGIMAVDLRATPPWSVPNIGM